MEKLTEKEKQMYEFIKDIIESTGYAPSIRDIQLALCIKSTSTVHAYLARLEEKGYIRRDAGKSRSVRMEEDSRPSRHNTTVKVPVMGDVAAGAPILAVENCRFYIDFPVTNIRNYDQLYALCIKGTSMIDAGILNGDIVVVNKCENANNGEIVVAMVDGEATVKRFFKEDGHFRLQPENKAMDPIIVNEVYILGKVIAVLRYL